jgi:hypothetical protein
MLTLGRMASAAGDGTALPALTIAGWFCLLPWLESVADSVAPDGYHLVREAAQAPPAAIREVAQNDNTLATTQDERADAGTAEPLPRCDEPARLFHGARSDSSSR